MCIADEPPNIILLVEVIPKAQVAPIDRVRLALPGYNAYFNFDPGSSNLGSSGIHGIAIYVNSSIHAYQFHDVGSFHEQLWISVLLVGKDLLLLGCVYHSPSSVASTSTHQLCRLLKSVSSLSTHLLVCGDFNYSNIDWTTGCGHTSDPCAQLFLDTIQDRFLFQHITLPTRYRHGQLSNALDLVLTNEEHMIDSLLF